MNVHYDATIYKISNGYLLTTYEDGDFKQRFYESKKLALQTAWVYFGDIMRDEAKAAT